MNTVLVVDIDPKRADLICTMFKEHHVRSRQCRDIDEIYQAVDEVGYHAVIIAHCALVNYSFTDLALLSHHPALMLILYCTEADKKPSRSIARLPEELTEILSRITDHHKIS